MPLPIFPRSRKCKSMSNVSNNVKHGVSKQRMLAKYNNNSSVSAKQALTKEISHWQELVIMSQNKQLEVIKIPNEDSKLNCNPFCTMCNQNVPCVDHAINNGSISKTTVLKSRDYNRINDKTDIINSHSKVIFKNNTKINGIKYHKEPQTNIETNLKNNGIRNDAIKNAIKRTNLRKLRNKNISFRRKSKEDIKEQFLDASATKSNLMSRKTGPRMRNI